MKSLYICLIIFFSFGSVYGVELGTGSGPGSTDINDPRKSYVPDKTIEEVKEKNKCTNEPDMSKYAVAECVKKGFIGSIADTIAMPFKAIASDQECYYNETYKKGLMSVVAPLIVVDSAEKQSYNYENWPKGAQETIEKSQTYQSYLRQGCTQIMRLVHNMEKRTLAKIHNKRLKQKEYDKYLNRGRTPSQREIENAERRWPIKDRILTPQEEAFERMYEERKRYLASLPKGPALSAQTQPLLE